MTSYSTAAPKPLSNAELEANPKQAHVRKRIIVCCDGTWEDSLTDKSKQTYTNVTRIARAIKQYDNRIDPPIPQIVFYQSGIGSVDSFYSRDVVGMLGSTLGAKIEEAYGFICSNYTRGDEVILLGFSRGAYTARMVAMFIGVIGVLNRTELAAFPTIFVAYQKFRNTNTNDSDEIEKQKKILEPYTQPTSPGRLRCGIDEGGFCVKCVAVFETVGEFGLPLELNLWDLIRPPLTAHNILGFPDDVLGTYVERAYQAFAIDEQRRDFVPVKFKQTALGRERGQVLHQCWFVGIHDDIGGGFERHNLSDITLAWMTSNLWDILCVDEGFILSALSASEPWGHSLPNKLTGFLWRLAFTKQRELPTRTDDVTCETVHASVLVNKEVFETHNNEEIVKLRKAVMKKDVIVRPLMRFEQEVKKVWEEKIARNL